ncbi:MAG TPA: hypothetical protein VGD87_14980 [Archangium sp.]
MSRAFFGLLFALLSGCYVCTPESCPDGCCTASGVCIVAPVEHTACGLGGGACVDCTQSGQQCVQSQCIARCSPATCNGCCLGTQCLSTDNQTSMRCGRGGETCSVCARGCSAGVCQ